MQNNCTTDTVVKLPSGVTVRLNDPDGKLQKSFQSLFGSVEEGLTVVTTTQRDKTSGRKK